MVFSADEVETIIRLHVQREFHVPEEKVGKVYFRVTTQAGGPPKLNEAEAHITTDKGTAHPYRSPGR